MKGSLRRLVVVTMILLAIAAIVSMTRSDVIAQIRAALVKNVDEPGRTPWETRSQFLPNAGGCFSTSDCYDYVDGTTFAMFDLRPVPAGKRWVVQMATGGLVNGDGRITTIELRSNRNGIVFDGAKWLFGGPYQAYPAFGSTIFSANIAVTFGPGEIPTVRVSGSPNLSGYSVLVFSGYLIDASN